MGHTAGTAANVALEWTRQYGEGNVFVLLLGHDARGVQTPVWQQLVLHGVDWTTAPLRKG
jgi:type 1 glutamine amidotransferase